MMRPVLSEHERLEELLVERATQGLEVQERFELGQLLVEHPEVDDVGLELAAAATDNYFRARVEGDVEPLPSHLRQKIAGSWHRQREGLETHSPGQYRTPEPKDSPGWAAPKLGAVLSSAAAFVIALCLGWVLRDQQTELPPLEERRARLIADSSDLLRWSWKGLGDPAFAGVTGEVVWSSTRQEGYMTLDGLPQNNPRDSQYQLWIVDPQRDEKHPVDGGVFDFAQSSQQVIVPIAAKLGVVEPQGFALTLEQPGGVVVSAGPLLTLAQP